MNHYLTVRSLTSFVFAVLLAICADLSAARAYGDLANPDFTKGESIPEGFKHDWNLGATGARGWMFSDKLVTTDARQIRITKVATGSPAAGVLAVGDVILGVGGKAFSYDPRTEFGKALTVAESEAGGGKLVLTRWRDGRSEQVTIKLRVLGAYGVNAPFDCPKSQRIYEQGCATLAKRVAAPSYRPDPILRSLNALALLASGKPEYLPLVRKESQWASGFSAQSMATWYYGYVTMFLAEYKMATGDDSVTPGLRRLAMEAAKGQSAVGSWGHGFARPDGRLGGYGMMNSPGVPLTISLVMARAAGVNDPEVSRAIERSLRLLRFYIGKGCIPYGDHAPWMETHEDNGKCGMVAVLFNLVDETKGAEFFARMSLCSHGPERDCGHTGNYFNILWAMPGVALSGPRAAGAWMKEFGAWYYDLSRQWDGGFDHLGPPDRDDDSYRGWDATGACLLAYAVPLRSLWLTGKRPGKVRQLDTAAAEEFILTGRGWNNKDRYSFYDKLSDDKLLNDLGSWSPIVRQRAGMALGRRKDPPIARVVALLDSSSLDARLGACQALAQLKGRAATAVPALRKTLHADDLWLRIKAADALAAVGKPAMEAVPEMLELLTRSDTQEDPRGMQQRFLTFALFDSREGLLGRSLEGVDRQRLYRAVLAGLKNEDGRARSDFESVYRNLSTDEIKPLLPAILKAVVEPAPSGEMFADGVRVAGLRLLAKHHVEEGIHACVDYIRSQNPWASERRTPELTQILVGYGAHAKAVVPELERIAAEFAKGEPDFPRNLSLKKAAAVREAIQQIQASNDRPELIRITEDTTKKVKVFILLGQSNMVGMGKIAGGAGSLENAVKVKKKYPYLVDEAGNWSERKGVRYVRVMSGRGGGMQQFNNEWMTVKTCRTIGPEFGIAHFVGDALGAPVLILKSCIGNRSLGWDLLPPGSERYAEEVAERNGQKVARVFAGYKDRPDSWVMDQGKGTATEPPPWLDKNGKPVDWYAGKQYDDDVAHAKKVLAELDKYYPGAQGYEVAGFFFWQGEKDCGNTAHAAHYEQNLVRFIKQLRKDFSAPDAKFVLATLGEATKGIGGNGGMVLQAQLAVDGNTEKYPAFKGNVATVYSNPLSKGGSGNSHYNGNAETYMDVGEAMGKAMVGLLKNGK